MVLSLLSAVASNSLGQYYIEASGRRIEGLGVMGHYTLNQTNNRFIGDIKIHNEEFR